MSQVLPRNLMGMKTFVLIAGILAAGIAAPARDSQPADVTVYVGDAWLPLQVDFRARATVTWMFAQVGVRLVWRDGKPERGTAPGSGATIQVIFTRRAPDGASQAALARALPFGEEGVAITVMYDRICEVARRSSREAPILAHVLAHEIGHVLQVTDQHAPDGVMKAHWSGQDLDAMVRKPLEFTSFDVYLIRDGLNRLKARSASSPADVSR